MMEDLRGEKGKQTAQSPFSVQAGHMKPSTTLMFRSTTDRPTSREEKAWEGFMWGGWGCGEGFVTPAGNGVSVPPRDKSLPSSLQSKLGTKDKMCIFVCFVLFLFSLFIFVESFT